MQNDHFIKANTKEFWRATLALTIGAFVVFSNLHITQPLLPLLSKDFGISPATASLTVTLVTLTLSAFLLFFGPVSDAVGRKQIMALGLLASSIISIIIFFAPNFASLVALRAVQGVFLASLPAIAYAYIGEEFETKSVAMVIGIYISGNSLGGMAGRIISGFVADFWGWRFSFLVMGLFGLISFLVFLFLLPRSSNFRAKNFTKLKAIQDIFIHWRNPVLRRAYYLAGIIFFIFVGLFNYLGYYLHAEPYYLSTTIIGLLYLTYLAGTFSSTLSGKLADRLTIVQRIFFGLVITLVGLLLMLLKPLVIIFIALIFIVFGFFFTHSAASSWVSFHAKEARASASALYLFSYYMGGSMGSSFLGYIWEPFGWNAVILVTIILVLLGMWNVKLMSQLD